MNADMNINELKFAYQINSAIYEVSRTLGAGFLEKVYKKALMFEMKERGMRVINQAPPRK